MQEYAEKEVCLTLFYTMCKGECDVYIRKNLYHEYWVFIDAEKDAKRRKFIQKKKTLYDKRVHKWCKW